MSPPDTAYQHSGNGAERLDHALLQLSHELRTPLTALKGFTQLLLAQEHYLSPEEQHVFLLEIDTAADRLEAATARILDEARIPY
jgi:signal transduction histidine kinase